MTPPITRRSFLKALVIAPAVPILPPVFIELPAAESAVEPVVEPAVEEYATADSWPIDPEPNEEDGSLCTEEERKENYRLYKASIRMGGRRR